MIREWLLPGLLETGPVSDRVMVIRDGVVNFFVVKGPKGLVCIDAGWRWRGVQRGFRQLGLDVRDVNAVFLTHWHWDHARCCELYPNARVITGSSVQDDQTISAAGLDVRVIGTPGHTSDSLSYLLDDGFLFTGDAVTLRRGKVVPFPSIFNRDVDSANSSIHKLSRISGVACLLTAHSGVTRDVGSAFQNWRESMSEVRP